jgi:hypothetical protein
MSRRRMQVQRLHAIKLVLALLVLASCSTSAIVPLVTRTLAPDDVCAFGLFAGTLSNDPVTGLGLMVGQGHLAHVWWPDRWSARTDGPRIALVQPDGMVVAHVGDDISLGGGYGSDGWIRVCPGSIRVLASPAVGH